MIELALFPLLVNLPFEEPGEKLLLCGWLSCGVAS